MRYIFIILSVFVLVGCGSTPRKIDLVHKQEQEPVILQVPRADQLELHELEFFFLTEKNFNKKFAEIKKKEDSTIFVALTEKGYELLAINMSKLRSFMQQQKQIIRAYKKFYEFRLDKKKEK